MPNGGPRSVHLRIHEVMQVLRHLWPERVLSREAASIARKLAACLPSPDGPDLSTPEGRRNVTREVWPASDVSAGATVRASPVVAMAVKAALAIDDVLSERPHLVRSKRFMRVVTDLGWFMPIVRLADCRSKNVPTLLPGMGDMLVEFSFPWRPSPMGTGQRLGISTAHVCLPALDSLDAPVACSLWTPEGRLEVRRQGTSWLRPVLSPGSWKPIALGEFRELAASGEAWRDSPFLPYSGRCCPTFHLCDYASPRAVAKGDDRRIEEARDASLARAGWLCVIDDIVHRATDEPMAGMATLIMDGEVQVGPAWALGDLDSTWNMDVLDCFEGDNGHWALGRPHLALPGEPPCRRGFVSLSDWTALVGIMPPIQSGGRIDDAPPWPRHEDLVRLECHVPEVTDGSAALNSAAELSPRVLRLFSREALRPGLVHELGVLADAITSLHGTVRDAAIRQGLLSHVRTLATSVSEVLRGAADRNDAFLAYVAALAIHAVTVESARQEAGNGVDEGLDGLQL